MIGCGVRGCVLVPGNTNMPDVVLVPTLMGSRGTRLGVWELDQSRECQKRLGQGAVSAQERQNSQEHSETPRAVPEFCPHDK